MCVVLQPLVLLVSDRRRRVGKVQLDLSDVQHVLGSDQQSAGGRHRWEREDGGHRRREKHNDPPVDWRGGREGQVGLPAGQ